MGEKIFKLEQGLTNEGAYKHDFIEIINSTKKAVLAIQNEGALYTETHEYKHIDARHEIKELEPVRKDICEAFGVPFDTEHVYIDDEQDITGPKEQRSIRAFYVLADIFGDEKFYGEGRTGHNDLLLRLIELNRPYNPDITFEDVVKAMNENPPRYMFFKGFLGGEKDPFSGIIADSRLLESPVYDKEGNAIQTPTNWFLTGHNVPLPKNEG